eukprot:jgi/Bigna1/70793/fgenesh1_pg.13_\
MEIPRHLLYHRNVDPLLRRLALVGLTVIPLLFSSSPTWPHLRSHALKPAGNRITLRRLQISFSPSHSPWPRPSLRATRCNHKSGVTTENSRGGGQEPSHFSNQTAQWLSQVIIGMDVCPWAGRMPQKAPMILPSTSSPKQPATAEQRAGLNLIELSEDQESSIPAIIEHVKEEARRLAAVDLTTKATTLLILPGRQPFTRSFSAFLSSLLPQASTAAFEATGGAIQVVPFHPNATYAEEDDAYDFSTRSPYPTLHLLRESDLRAAETELQSRFGDVDNFKARNARYLRAVGFHEMTQFIEGIKNGRAVDRSSSSLSSSSSSLPSSPPFPAPANEEEWILGGKLRRWLTQDPSLSSTQKNSSHEDQDRGAKTGAAATSSSPSGCCEAVLAKLKIVENIDGYGSGAVATRAIRRGEVIVRIPARALMTADTARTDPVLGPIVVNGEGGGAMTDGQCLLLALLYHSYLGTRSPWHDYIAILPQPPPWQGLSHPPSDATAGASSCSPSLSSTPSFEHPLLLGREAREQLLGSTPLRTALDAREQHVREDMDTLNSALAAAAAAFSGTSYTSPSSSSSPPPSPSAATAAVPAATTRKYEGDELEESSPEPSPTPHLLRPPPNLTYDQVAWASAIVASRAFRIGCGFEDGSDDDDDGDGKASVLPPPPTSVSLLRSTIYTPPMAKGRTAFPGCHPDDNNSRLRSSNVVALVPWADMLNHGESVGMDGILRWEEGRGGVKRERRDDDAFHAHNARDDSCSDDFAVLRADTEYRPGEQVFDSYGINLSPIEAFLNYGFASVSEATSNSRGASLENKKAGQTAWLPLEELVRAAGTHCSPGIDEETGEHALILKLLSMSVPSSMLAIDPSTSERSLERMVAPVEWSFDIGGASDEFYSDEDEDFDGELPNYFDSGWESSQEEGGEDEEGKEGDGQHYGERHRPSPPITSAASEQEPAVEASLGVAKILVATHRDLIKAGWSMQGGIEGPISAKSKFKAQGLAAKLSVSVANRLHTPEEDAWETELESRALRAIALACRQMAVKYEAAISEQRSLPNTTSIARSGINRGYSHIAQEAAKLMRHQATAFR